jgi:hypothetical protein
MSPKLYLETTVVSYLTARPSKDLIITAHQQLTQVWWENRSGDFDLYTSQLVVQESSSGEAGMAQRRLSVLDKVPMLAVNRACIALAGKLVDKGPIPQKASVDALHIAIATVNGMDYLLTWNCKHIANAEMQTAVTNICRAAGYEPPVICTPEELMGS